MQGTYYKTTNTLALIPVFAVIDIKVTKTAAIFFGILFRIMVFFIIFIASDFRDVLILASIFCLFLCGRCINLKSRCTIFSLVIPSSLYSFLIFFLFSDLFKGFQLIKLKEIQIEIGLIMSVAPQDYGFWFFSLIVLEIDIYL